MPDSDLLGESISYIHSGKKSIIEDIDLMRRENRKGRKTVRWKVLLLPYMAERVHAENILKNSVIDLSSVVRLFPPLLIFCLWFLRAH